MVERFSDFEGDDNHFSDTILGDEADTLIVSGSASFVDTFLPEGDLGLMEGKELADDRILELVRWSTATARITQTTCWT